MQFRADSLGLVGTVTPVLRDLIHERLGLSYQPHQFDQVADRLAPLVVARGLTSFMDYYYVLKYGDDRDEWLRVIDALAVQETYFWREIDQLRAIVDHVVPQVAPTLRGEPLRIWSVPCATGEEPLTLAMLLEDAGWFSRLPIEILGSDASTAAVTRARAGVFTQRAFRNLPAPMFERYFTATAGGWQIAPDLHRRVTFDVVNLMNADAVRLRARVPIVLCRNLFIYFSETSIRRAVDSLTRAMVRPGYLGLGAAESLLRYTTAFELREIGGAFVYVLDPVPVERAAGVLAGHGPKEH